MRCLRCQEDRSSVVDSRADNGSIRRRRECQGCGFRFTTFERIELTLPVVVKKDGRREPFDRVKAQTGIMRACEKRPISVETIDQLVDSIERSLNELYLREVPSRQVGELILKALRTVDEIAYIRFASVYQEFSDVHQFVEILRSLGREQFTTEVADDS